MLSRKQLQFFSMLSIMMLGVGLMWMARNASAAAPGTELVIVNANDGGATFEYIYGATEFSLADGESETLVPIFAGNMTVFQTVVPGYEITIECVDDTGATVPTTITGTNGVTVNVPDGERITCTFTNTDIAGSFTVVNQTNSGNTFDYVYGSTNFSLAPGESYSQTGLNPGNFSVFQTLQTGIDLTISCVGGDVTPIGTNGITMMVDAGEDIVCTFDNNDVAGSFTIAVTSNTPAVSFDFIYGANNFSLTDGQTYAMGPLNPGDYSVFQTLLPGYETTVSCTGGDVDLVGTNGVTMHVDANEDIVCTFDNNYVGADVTLTTQINGGTATSIDYITNFGDFSHANGDSFNQGDVMPGDYNLFATVPQGYVMDFACTGTTFDPIGTNGATLHIAANETASCTATFNYIAGTVTIVNSTTPASATPFGYATSFGDFDLNDGESYMEPIVMPGTYFAFETVQEGYDLAIECTGADYEAIGTNGINIFLEANEDAVCTFTNTDSNGGNGGENLLTNGDFELGQDNSWREQSTWNFDLVVHESAYGGTVPPQSGEYLAWLGGARWENSYISQAVDLPAGEDAVVSFSYWIESRDWCGYDWGAVYIYDGDNFYRVWVQTLCRGTETNGWAEAEIDVSAFAGQSVRVLFNAKNDSVYRSSMYIDDVAVTTVVAGRSATTEIAGADPKEVGSGEAEEVMNNDMDAITQEVTKPERDENNRLYQDDVITQKELSGTTAVALSSANAESASSSVAVIASLLAMVVVATAALLGNKRREQ